MSFAAALNFRVESAAAVPFAASPLLSLQLEIASPRPVHTVALRTQVQIEAQRRDYAPAEQAALDELFGPPARWAQTLRPLLWTHLSTLVPAFSERGRVELQLPCSYDFSLATAKYFHAVSDGEVPLLLLFSGTVFYAGEGGVLTVAPIPWSQEARFRLPVRVLEEVREQHYPGSASLLLRRDLFERLRRYKAARGFTSWEQALEQLLDGEAAAAARAP